MNTYETNWDGIVGPTHHYGGLGVGNVASQAHKHAVSHPKAGALQGLAKMAKVANLGVPQFFLPPIHRPNRELLTQAGFSGTMADQIKRAFDEAPEILSATFSSAFMWTANAATVCPVMDSTDGNLHVTPANLCSNLHRQMEAHQRYQQFEHIFREVPNTQLHRPLPCSLPFRDEGAANHMRLGKGDAKPWLHVYVDGEAALESYDSTQNLLVLGGRHGRKASLAIARQHQLPPDHVFFLHQSPDAIQAGVFHNDVIATSHENLLVYHERAFQDAEPEFKCLRARFQKQFGEPLFEILVQESQLSLEQAVKSYLFNSQIVSAEQGMVLICPEQCRDLKAARELIAGWVRDPQNPIVDVCYLPLDQSMANGGGPACLRLRIQMTKAQIAAVPAAYRFSDQTQEKLIAWIEHWYPESLTLGDLARVEFAEHAQAAADHFPA